MSCSCFVSASARCLLPDPYHEITLGSGTLVPREVNLVTVIIDGRSARPSILMIIFVCVAFIRIITDITRTPQAPTMVRC